MLLSRGRPVTLQGDRGTRESRLRRLGVIAGVDNGGLARFRARWVSIGPGFVE